MAMWFSDLNEIHELDDAFSIVATYSVAPADHPDGDMAMGNNLLWIVTFHNADDNQYIAQMEQDGNILSQNLLDNSWGLEYFDGHIWSADQFSKTIRKVDPSTFSVVDTISFPTGVSAISGLAYDGVGLWVRGNTLSPTTPRLFQLDPVDGAILDNQVLPTGASLGGLAWDDGHIWVLVPFDTNQFIKWNPSTQAIDDGFPSPSGVRPQGVTLFVAVPPSLVAAAIPLRLKQRTSQQGIVESMAPRIYRPNTYW